jgi:sulfur transfer complex TusBCD TusB component (DsrH family)
MLLQVLSNNALSLQPYIEDPDITIVLLQDGVYLLPELIQQIPANRLFVLESDWLASGLAQINLHELKVNLISAEQWVNMAAEHFNILTLQS